MRVLLDEQLPRQLSAYLVGHEVRTVQQQHWAGTKNGELLRLAAEAGSESFLRADHNLEYQQNLQAMRLGIVVLVATSNALEDLLPLVPQTLEILGGSSHGVAMFDADADLKPSIVKWLAALLLAESPSTGR